MGASPFEAEQRQLHGSRSSDTAPPAATSRPIGDTPLRSGGRLDAHQSAARRFEAEGGGALARRFEAEDVTGGIWAGRPVLPRRSTL
jgi:hypothetical protein